MYSILNHFVTKLAAELRVRATEIALSVDRTGTTSDYGIALILRTIADAIDSAWRQVPR